MTTMICSRCKKTIPRGRLFCPHCAAPVTETATHGKRKRSRTVRIRWHTVTHPAIKKIHLWHIAYFWGVTVALAIVMSAVIGWLWYAVMEKPSFADFLPRDETVFFAEVEFKPESWQVHNWNALFHDSSVPYSLSRWTPDVQAFFGSLTPTPSDLFGTHAGFAVLTIEDEPVTLGIIEVKDTTRLEDALNRITHPSGTLTLGTSEYRYQIQDKNLFFSRSSDVFRLLGNEQANRLSRSVVYQQLISKLNPIGIAQVYYKPMELYVDLLRLSGIPWVYDLRYTLFSSVLMQNIAVVADIGTDNTDMIVRSVSLPAEKGGSSVISKADPALLATVRSQDAVVFAGANLGRSLERTRENVTLGTLSLSIPLEKLQNQIQDRAQSNIFADLAERLNSPYIIAVGGDPHAIRIVLKVSESEAQSLIQSVTSLLNAYAPYTSPLLKKITTRDGSEAEELVVNPESRTNQQQTQFGATTLTSLSVPGTDTTLYFAYGKGLFFASTDSNYLEQSLSREPSAWMTKNFSPNDQTAEYTLINVSSLNLLLLSLFSDSKAAHDHVEPAPSQPAQTTELVSWDKIVAKYSPFFTIFSRIIDESQTTWDATYHTTRFSL